MRRRGSQDRRGGASIFKGARVRTGGAVYSRSWAPPSLESGVSFRCGKKLSDAGDAVFFAAVETTVSAPVSEAVTCLVFGERFATERTSDGDLPLVVVPVHVDILS